MFAKSWMLCLRSNDQYDIACLYDKASFYDHTDHIDTKCYSAANEGLR